MRIAVVTLAVDDQGLFDDGPLRAFCEQHDVLSASEYRFDFAGEPRLAFVLSCRARAPARQERQERHEPTARQGDTDALLATLTPTERHMFERLRAWRNARMKALGRPPFVILTNKQIVDIVQRRPATLAELREVDGIGESKSEQFGQEILDLLREPTGEEAPT